MKARSTVKVLRFARTYLNVLYKKPPDKIRTLSSGCFMFLIFGFGVLLVFGFVVFFLLCRFIFILLCIFFILN